MAKTPEPGTRWVHKGCGRAATVVSTIRTGRGTSVQYRYDLTPSSRPPPGRLRRNGGGKGRSATPQQELPVEDWVRLFRPEEPR